MLSGACPGPLGELTMVALWGTGAHRGVRWRIMIADRVACFPGTIAGDDVVPFDLIESESLLGRPSVEFIFGDQGAISMLMRRPQRRQYGP